MAFKELERKRIEKVVGEYIEKHRPPPHIRSKLDLGFRIVNQSVEIFEVRPGWRAPGKTIIEPVAKATFVRTQQVWKVYWRRQDLKWHAYQPDPKVSSIEEFLILVDEDAYACFFG